MTIKFYKTKDSYGVFSNFARYSIFVDGKIWPSSEHYFQAMKFADEDRREAVRVAHTPREAARMGRDRAFPIREGWDEIHRDQYMAKALFAKFTQYPELKEILLETKSSWSTRRTIRIGGTEGMAEARTCWANCSWNFVSS